MIRQLNNPRELRGLKILSEPGSIIQVNKNEWDVRSQSIDAYYHVARIFPKDRQERMRSPGTWTCSCPDHATRNVICKHIYAVQLSLKIAGEIEEHSAVSHIEAEPKITCPICKSENITKWGNRKTTFGEIQRFACKECNHTFVVDKGFFHMKNSPKTITLTLDLYFK
jgi:putative transposase